MNFADRTVFTLVATASLLLACASLPIAVAQGSTNSAIEFPQVGLIVPEPAGFERSSRFHGFQQASTGASVMLTVVPGPFAEVSRSFNAESLAKQGMQLEEKSDLTVQDAPGYLLRVRQSAYGQMYVKWVLVFGDAQRTSMVTASVPTQYADDLAEEVQRVLGGVRAITLVADAVKDLPFTLQPAKGLVPVRQMTSVGKMLAFTKDGRMPVASPSDPLFIAAPSLGRPPVDDRREFSVQRLYSLAHTDIDSVTFIQEILVDGLPGYEILAAATDQRSGTPLAVYQATLFQDGGGYVLMVGIVGREESTEHLLRFKTTAGSLRQTER